MANFNYPSSVYFDKCEDEPIHHIGRIQSFGALLVVDNSSNIIIQSSENIELFLLKDFNEIIGTKITDYLPDFSVSFFDNPVEISPILREYRPANWVTHNIKQQIHTRVFVDKNNYVIELEHVASLEEKMRAFEMVNKITEVMQKAKEQTELFQLFVDSVAQWLDYDRVMVFKYDKEYNGEVVAESLKNPSVKSFLNHHFPPKDIPKQARKMLAEKKVRIIEDVHGKSVGLYPYIPQGKDEPSDLSLSETRNPSEIHLQYLKNMGVKSTLTCVIFHKQKVCGLLCCHHISEPKYVYQKIRSLLLSLTNIFSEMMQSIEVKQNSLIFNRKLSDLQQIKQKLFRNFSLVTTFLDKNTQKTLELFNANGVVIAFDSKISAKGKTPSSDIIKDLLEWISQQHYTKYFCTREMPILENINSEKCRNEFSGFLAVEISRIDKEYIIWFRPEIRQVFKMVGERYAEFGEELSPRATFESWLREVKGKCEKWEKTDIDIAEVIYHDLSPVLHYKNTKLKKINQYLKKTLRNLRYSENILEWLYNSNSNAYFFIDKDYTIVTANKKAFEIMFDFSQAKNIVNTNILDYLDAEQKRKFIEYAHQVWQGETIYYKDSYLDTDAINRMVDVSIFPVSDGYNRIVGLGINVVDVTNKIKQNQKILELGALADYVSDLVLVIDQQFMIIWANKTFLDFNGYTQTEICGQDMSELLAYKKNNEKGFLEIQNAINNAEYIKIEMLQHNKKGEKYWVFLEIQPVKDIDQELITFICLQKIIMFEFGS